MRFRIKEARDKIKTIIDDIDAQSEIKVEELLESFRVFWGDCLSVLSSLTTAMSDPLIISQMDSAHYETFNLTEQGLYENRRSTLSLLEETLERIEDERVDSIGNQLIEYGQTLYHLVYENPSQVVREIQVYFGFKFCNEQMYIRKKFPI